MKGSVIAAVDLGPLTGRVLFHAAAFARLLQAPLKVLHVSSDASDATRQRVLNACLRLSPYQIDFEEQQIAVRTGRVSDAIAREAAGDAAALVVVGSRTRNLVAKLLLGSTSDSVLKNATAPILVVPPIDVDIVSIDDAAKLTCGPVVAAVDLADDSTAQLRLASKLAQISAQPLLLMTVAKSRVTDHDAAAALRERAHGLNGTKPRELIVRRGTVAQEISRCVVAEGAGLVVMGLRTSPRGQPGSIASAVLRTGRAFVLAVPNRPVATVRRRFAAAPLVATASLLFALAAAASANNQFPDQRAVVEFQRAADTYAFAHRQVERRLGLAHRAAGLPMNPIETAELAAAIRADGLITAGRLFAPAAVEAFRAAAARAVHRNCDAGELRTGVWELSHVANGSADGTTPVAACLAAALPHLPAELEYRSAGTVLLVVDTHANLVVDVLPALLAGSDLR